jgi:hypothetical protein
MISLPADYSGISPDQLFGMTGVTLAAWVPSALQYAMTPNAPADTMHIGQGYWTRLPQNATITMAGTPADPTKDFAIPLAAGWNMIGDPFNAGCALSDLKIAVGGQTYSFGDATGGKVNLVAAVLWAYETGSGSYMQAQSLTPGSGYWIHANTAVTLIVPALGV